MGLHLCVLQCKGSAWLYPKDNFCSLLMVMGHMDSFQRNNHFDLSGWQFSGFGDAVTPNFHILNCCFNISYLKWWLMNIY